ncbi:MAG TPA: 50S ribosomal protein L13 [Candidatus Omnitrophica bacterium]|nr:50S ribosomal protein L13 [Candidatus Omnitrophota bacterium]
MKTFRIADKDIDHKVWLINAEGKTLGRLATKVAGLLLGKGKPYFAHDQICGDYVVVINAAKVKVTGRKPEQKTYTHYSGFPGGLKEYTYEDLMAKKPTEVITRAVSRMLPKHSIGEEMRRRLRVFEGAEHNQQAQKPVAIEV